MTPSPSGTNLFESFRAAFPANPSSTLMTLSDGRVVSYGDLEKQSASIACKITQAGAKPGDRLMMQVEKTPQAIALYLACMRAGVIFIPLNTGYGRDELVYLAGDAEPSVVVCDPASPFLGGKFPFPTQCAILSLDSAGHGSLMDQLQDLPDQFETVDRGGDDIAAILYTSGTTGKPKGAMLSHNNLRSNAEALVRSWGITSSDVLLHALPIFHTHGLFVATNTTLLSGSRLIFLPKFNVDQMLEGIETATMMMGVPTFYTRLLSDPRLTKSLCSKMRLFVSGSAPLLAETHITFETRTGHRILERYGMTETNMITTNPLDGERRAGTVGHALQGVSVRITDEAGNTLPQGDIGSIEVSGPNVFKGYWRNPEKTAAEFRPDGFFMTGDIGQIDANGYLSIVGRSKDLIISGGFNIYPKEVEEIIDDLDGVLESAVVGLPHKDFGEGVAAIVVAKSKTLTPEDVIAHCRDHLAIFKSPKAVILVDALPRNTMGKVEKAKLRHSHKAQFAN